MPIYRRAWNLFSQFIYATNIAFSATLPISPSTLALFIAYLFDKNYAPATGNTYVSALGYLHRLSDLPDPSKAFFILQMLKGYGKIGFRLDSRLPITLPILHKLIEAANNFSLSSFLIARFQAMCLLAFHAFLRVGEITTSSGNKGNPPLAIYQITKMVNEQKEIVALKLTFGNFKHSYNQHPFSIEVSRRNDVCPVQHIMKYLSLRGSGPGPIFISADGSPVP
ncbi:predicted protein, partial [Nematostella vectensis]